MASSSQATASKRGKKTQDWSWWDEVHSDKIGPTGGARSWSCKLCPYKRKGGADKVRAHLLHESGHEVRFCERITAEKKRELLERVAANESTSSARASRVAIDPNTLLFPSQAASAKQSDSHGARNFTMPSSHTPYVPRRQSTLDSSWDPKKEETDAAVARFFFHDHIPFQIAR